MGKRAGGNPGTAPHAYSAGMKIIFAQRLVKLLVSGCAI